MAARTGALWGMPVGAVRGAVVEAARGAEGVQVRRRRLLMQTIRLASFGRHPGDRCALCWPERPRVVPASFRRRLGVWRTCWGGGGEGRAPSWGLPKELKEYR